MRTPGEPEIGLISRLRFRWLLSFRWFCYQRYYRRPPADPRNPYRISSHFLASAATECPASPTLRLCWRLNLGRHHHAIYQA